MPERFGWVNDPKSTVMLAILLLQREVVKCSLKWKRQVHNLIRTGGKKSYIGVDMIYKNKSSVIEIYWTIF